MYVCSINTHLCWTNPKECHLINRGIKASATHDRFVLVSLNFQGNKRILQCNKNVNSRRQQCGQTDAKWSKYAPTYTHTDSFGLRTLEHLLKTHFTLSAKCSRLFVIDVFVVVVIVAGEQWTVTSTHTHTDTHRHTLAHTNFQSFRRRRTMETTNALSLDCNKLTTLITDKQSSSGNNNNNNSYSNSNSD